MSAVLSSSTSGVTITQANSAYPDIAGGTSEANSTDYVFSLDSAFACGDAIAFHLAVSSSEGSYSADVTLPTGILEPRVTVLTDDFESGANGWTTAGSFNTWALTTESANSPTHSWTDSPGGNYGNNTNSWLISPVFNLNGRDNVRLSASYTWELEAGYDYVYVEYSTNGGTSWATSTPLASFNGSQAAWTPVDTDAPALDGQGNARIRFRLQSDGGVVADGIHIDDFSLSYQPVVCQYPAVFRDGFETGDTSQWSSATP